MPQIVESNVRKASYPAFAKRLRVFRREDVSAINGHAAIDPARFRPGAISIADGALAGDSVVAPRGKRLFGEKANCAPDGAWPTCAYGRHTGHYINLSQSGVAWVRLGEDLRPAKASSGIGGLYPFDVMAVPI